MGSRQQRARARKLLARSELPDSVGDAQALEALHRFGGSIAQHFERFGSEAQIVDRDVSGLQGEAPQPAHGGSLAAVGIAVSEYDADTERVVQRDTRQFPCRCEDEQFVADLEGSFEPNVSASVTHHRTHVRLRVKHLTIPGPRAAAPTRYAWRGERNGLRDTSTTCRPPPQPRRTTT